MIARVQEGIKNVISGSFLLSESVGLPHYEETKPTPALGLLPDSLRILPGSQRLIMKSRARMNLIAALCWNASIYQ